MKERRKWEEKEKGGAEHEMAAYRCRFVSTMGRSVGRAERWEKTVKEERKQHEWAITDIRAELRQEMAQMRRELQGRIGGIAQENIELKKENKKLREVNERLKSQLNNNSNNSSKPPSSGQKPSKRANEYNGRKSSGKNSADKQGDKGKL